MTFVLTIPTHSIPISIQMGVCFINFNIFIPMVYFTFNHLKWPIQCLYQNTTPILVFQFFYSKNNKKPKIFPMFLTIPTFIIIFKHFTWIILMNCSKYLFYYLLKYCHSICNSFNYLFVLANQMDSWHFELEFAYKGKC